MADVHRRQVEQRAGQGRDVDVIDIDADALFEPVAGEAERHAEAADIDRGVARVRRIDLQRRRKLLKLHDVEIARRLNRIAPDNRDRNRHFLRGFLTTARGHDDDVFA